MRNLWKCLFEVTWYLHHLLLPFGIPAVMLILSVSHPVGDTDNVMVYIVVLAVVTLVPQFICKKCPLYYIEDWARAKAGMEKEKRDAVLDHIGYRS